MPEESISVELVRQEHDGLHRSMHRLGAGASIRSLLSAVGIVDDTRQLIVAVHGAAAHIDQPLHDGDRVELMAPVRANAKAARRERVARARAEGPEGRRWNRDAHPRG